MKQTDSLPKEKASKKGSLRSALSGRQLSYLIMMLIPVVYFLLIRYWPMYGLAISFQNYKVGDPFVSPASNWVGFQWFKMLFAMP
ncbi:MAG: hypothetical protein IJL72_10790, partial [Lachnospiraceae bacterium]|nr:hypothetical protein [Lachnospiraceae bacterium]